MMVPRTDKIGVAFSIKAKIFENFRSYSTVLRSRNMATPVIRLVENTVSVSCHAGPWEEAT